MIRPLFENTWLIRHTPALRRLAIIAACCALSFLAGRLAMNPRFPLIAGGAAGAAVLVVLIFKPDWGVLALLACTLFLKIGFSTGTQSPITLSLALTGALTAAWIARMLVEGKRVKLAPTPVNAPLIAFMAVALLSYVWSGLVHDPFVDNWDTFARPRLGALGTFLLSPAAALLVANQLRTTRQLRIAVGMFLCAMLLGLIGIYTKRNIPLLNTDGLFPLWAITLSAGQALFNRQLSTRIRLGLGAMAVLWFLYQFGSGITWVSGWAPPIVAGFILIWLRSRRLAVALAIIASIYIYTRTDYLQSTLSAEHAESGSTRIAAWQANWNLTREHLLLGTGPAGYAAYYMTYFPTAAMATHNNYIDIIAQTGLLGSAMLIWFMAATGRAAWRVARQTPGNGFEHALAVSLLAGIAGLFVAMGLGDWFIPFAYTQGIAGYDYTVWGWIMIGLVMVLHHRFVTRPDAEKQPALLPNRPLTAFTRR